MGPLRIAVVVPTVKPAVFASFIGSLLDVERKPDMLFVIDNSQDSISVGGYPGEYLVSHGLGLTVNESWNLGRQMANDYDVVSFLNDDILLNKYFFNNIARAFKTVGRYCGVVCPRTAKKIEQYAEMKDLSMQSEHPVMTSREGWAFSISRAALAACPLIPADTLKTFCGDDWIWHYTHKAGFHWHRDLSSVIYHAIGGTVKGTAIRETLKHERREFKRLIACE